jgi:hypothetical protein
MLEMVTNSYSNDNELLKYQKFQGRACRIPQAMLLGFRVYYGNLTLVP